MQWTEAQAQAEAEAAAVNADGHDLGPDEGTSEVRRRTTVSVDAGQGAWILEGVARHGSKDGVPTGEMNAYCRQRRKPSVTSHPWRIFLLWSLVLAGGCENEGVLLVAVLT